MPAILATEATPLPGGVPVPAVRRRARVPVAFLGAAALGLLSAPAGAAGAGALSAPTMYKLPNATSSPRGIAVGPDGALWFTEANGKRIGRITTSGSITEFPLGAGASPMDVTTGGDGNIWFTDAGASPNVSRLVPSTHVITPFALPGGSSPQGITAAADGNVWLAESGAESIARVTPTGTITPFKTLFAGDLPTDVTPAPPGEETVWYAAGSSHVGIQALNGLSAAETSMPNSKSFAEAITTGPGAEVWVAESSAYLGHLFSVFSGVGEFPQLGAASNVTPGPDGNLWWTNEFSSQIARTLPTGAPLDYVQLAKTSSPYDLVTGPDGAVWFTDIGENAIGRGAVPARAPLPTGPRGPAGPAGPTGPTGPTGAPGPAGHLVVVAFQASVTKARVTISFALTDPAQVSLSVSPPKGRAATVAKTMGVRGVNRISWNRKLSGKRAKKGLYRLTLLASSSGSRASTTSKVALK